MSQNNPYNPNQSTNSPLDTSSSRIPGQSSDLGRSQGVPGGVSDEYDEGGLTTPAARPVGASTQGARVVGRSESLQGDGPGPFLMLADSLEGDEVVNGQGDKLGDIKGIMLDVQRGQIAYAVLSVGGFLGIGDKLFAIPWGALTLDADNKCFILEADKSQFKEAEGFDKDHWPSMADMTWASQVHAAYRTRPYWEDSDTTLDPTIRH
ncbi:PRC-barrel domain-containing protein [Chitiniphilus purpureus]|uniref:PRC-barrel domain-containing protein n=1 Tax=Chitiniphilus purpureus TaxID=2981137 RepID=A0ABY6DJB1_9NEIS|nr:PRC-barrel domain-containing protein [Chitiniphilus sp. CD1]UXY14446.1 PRC-barrel domain-containing protein [Chitiniphilus sp. CD1]